MLARSLNVGINKPAALAFHGRGLRCKFTQTNFLRADESAVL
jgi:hypothetical protein